MNSPEVDRSQSPRNFDEKLASLPIPNSSPIADAILARDWSKTPLGPIESWPNELRFALSLILETKFPHFIAWGDEMILLFNDAYTTVVDDPEVALGARFDTYWVDAWGTVGPIARAAMAGTSSYFENLSIRMARAGRWSRTWWTFAMSPIRLGNGEVGGLFCTVTETTRQKVLERQLEDSARSLRRFTDLVPNFLWESDAHGRLHYMNSRMQAYTGFSRPEEVTDWSAFVHPEDVARVVGAYADAQDRQGSFECQHRFRAADGSYRWYLAKAQPVYDDKGGVSGWFGCATDIHNWRVHIDELRKSEDLVRRFAENAARILWIADLDRGNVEYINAAGRRFWNVGPEREIAGWESWFRIVHPDDHVPTRNALELLRAGETVSGVYRVADGDGKFCDLRATLFPITDANGQLEKFGGMGDLLDVRKRRLVHLVDPDRGQHRRLSAQLWAQGYEVRGFTDVQAFAKVAPALLPGCVVVRAGEHLSWVGRVVAAAAEQGGRLRTVVMTDQYRDADHVRTLMKQGAADVLAHDADWESLVAAIEDATRGLDEPESVEAVRARGEQQKLALLSLREREILDRLTGGATNKVVAIELGISPRTVEAHRARIFEKLGVSSLAEAVALRVNVAAD